MINNAFYYPVNAGYDAALHLTYAKIISEELRLPTFIETRENYNPPLFYLISGLLIRFSSYVFGVDFFQAAKIWQFINILLAFTSIYLWRQIIKQIYSNNQNKNYHILLFPLALLSFPVWYKTIVMFSIEAWFLFTSSLYLWFFIIKFIPKPNFVNVIILSLILIINLLTKINAFTLLAVTIIGLLGLVLIKKINVKKAIVYLLIVIVLVLSGSGWFYIGRRNQGIYGVGEGGEPDIPLLKRQSISFYTDIPFTLMMTYPMRQNQPLNKLIPIFYSEFWGDFWNYFPQRRYGLPVAEVRKNREVSNSQRIASLVLQNKINLLPTFLMVFGLIVLIYRLIRNFIYRKQWLIQVLLLIFFMINWCGFIFMLTKFPSWKGDSIKASYMLSLMPIFAYLLVIGLETVRSVKYLLTPLYIWLLINVIVNLSFSWF